MAVAASTSQLARNVPHPLLIAGAVAFAIAVLYARSRTALENPQFFAEDGTMLFAQQKLYGWQAIFIQWANHIYVLTRLVAAFADPFPSIYAPAIYAWASVALIGWAALTIAVSEVRFAWLYGALLTLPPHSGDCFATLVNVHWVMACALPFVAATPTPESCLVRANQLVFLGLMSFTGPISFLLSFVLLYRLWVWDRGSHAIALAGLCCTGAAIQIAIALHVRFEFAALGEPDPFHLMHVLF